MPSKSLRPDNLSQDSDGTRQLPSRRHTATRARFTFRLASDRTQMRRPKHPAQLSTRTLESATCPQPCLPSAAGGEDARSSEQPSELPPHHGHTDATCLRASPLSHFGHFLSTYYVPGPLHLALSESWKQRPFHKATLLVPILQMWKRRPPSSPRMCFC